MIISEASTPSPRIFLSYRREDSSGYAGRLFDALVEQFGEPSVFMDIDTIAPGQDFVQVIEDALSGCDVVLVMIGPNWLAAPDHRRRRRLDNPDDFVRMEIEAALQRNIRVLPVLVGGAEMPLRADLPQPMSALARRHAFEISDRRWHVDVRELISALAIPVAPRFPATPATKVAEPVATVAPVQPPPGAPDPPAPPPSPPAQGERSPRNRDMAAMPPAPAAATRPALPAWSRARSLVVSAVLWLSVVVVAGVGRVNVPEGDDAPLIVAGPAAGIGVLLALVLASDAVRRATGDEARRATSAVATGPANLRTWIPSAGGVAVAVLLLVAGKTTIVGAGSSPVLIGAGLLTVAALISEVAAAFVPDSHSHGRESSFASRLVARTTTGPILLLSLIVVPALAVSAAGTNALWPAALIAIVQLVLAIGMTLLSTTAAASRVVMRFDALPVLATAVVAGLIAAFAADVGLDEVLLRAPGDLFQLALAFYALFAIVALCLVRLVGGALPRGGPG